MEYRQYKKWLVHTLPRLQEWAESNADDNGPCPLSQDEANWILGLIQDLKSSLAKSGEKVKATEEAYQFSWAECQKLRSMCAKMAEALRKIAKPALGGKQQQRWAQEALASYEAMRKEEGSK